MNTAQHPVTPIKTVEQISQDLIKEAAGIYASMPPSSFMLMVHTMSKSGISRFFNTPEFKKHVDADIMQFADDMGEAFGSSSMGDK